MPEAIRTTLMLTLALFAASCGGSTANNSKPAMVNGNTARSGRAPLPVYTYKIVNSYPHDAKAFTQGLFFSDGYLYESTGQEGASTLRRVDLATGKVLQKFDLPRESFAEGIALLNGKIYQLTWKEGIARVFDAKDFTLLREFPYQGEGWGLTTDGTNLFMSDSTHVIRVIDPETFKQVRTLFVLREDGKPLYQINEMEYVKGEIWANVWHSEDPRILGKPNYIARIDPNSGKLLGWVDLAGISPDDQAKTDSPDDPKAENTLNGIAYDAANDRIFVTGKNWKKLYEIKVEPK